MEYERNAGRKELATLNTKSFGKQGGHWAVHGGDVHATFLKDIAIFYDSTPTPSTARSMPCVLVERRTTIDRFQRAAYATLQIAHIVHPTIAQ